jgi:hypothetical protein
LCDKEGSSQFPKTRTVNGVDLSFNDASSLNTRKLTMCSLFFVALVFAATNDFGPILEQSDVMQSARMNADSVSGANKKFKNSLKRV